MRAQLDGCSNAVEFHGFATDVSLVWDSLGLLIISSHAEGLPMVALEALAAGIPVAASRVGALPELIQHGENGWLFEAGNVAELKAIVDTWDQRRRSDGVALRRAAWASVAGRFDSGSGVDATLAVYRAAGLRRQ